MRKNVDRVDRIVRGVVGVWLVAVAVSAYRAKRRTTAVTAGIAGFGLVQNAVVGYCGGNRLLGIDTTSADRPSGTDSGNGACDANCRR